MLQNGCQVSQKIKKVVKNICIKILSMCKNFRNKSITKILSLKAIHLMVKFNLIENIWRLNKTYIFEKKILSVLSDISSKNMSLQIDIYKTKDDIWLLKFDNSKKADIKKVWEVYFETDYKKESKIEAIDNNAVYISKTKGPLLGYYYLIIKNSYLQTKNILETLSVL